MGLDVILKRFDNFADTKRREAEYEKETEGLYEKGAYTDAQRDEKRIAVAARLNLGEWGSDKAHTTSIELPSAKYPKHLFKIGYFRSSYNSGGLNSVLRDLIGVTLNSICGHNDSMEYEFQPDWQMVKVRAIEAINKLDQFIADNGGAYGAMSPSLVHVNHPSKREATNESEAIQSFIAERKEWASRKTGAPDSFDNYGSLQGDFNFGEPLSIVGIIPGHDGRFMGGDRPCAWLIYKRDTSFYREALEIVAETADYVLAQPDADKYYVAWSS